MRAVEECGNCRRCRSYLSKGGPVCHHCLLEDTINDYENEIFAYRQNMKRRVSGVTAELGSDGNALADQQVGNFKMDGPVIQLNNVILRFITANERRLVESCPGLTTEWLVEQGRLGTKRYALMQKELTSMRLLWRQHFQLLSAWDELAMAVEPLRSIDPDCEVPEGLQDSVVIKGDEEYRFEKYQLDCAVAREELSLKLGQLRYLRNVETQRREGASRGSRQCAICMEGLESGGGDVLVIGCGHSYHKECIQYILSKQSASRSMKCPECRQVSLVADFVLVDDTKTAGDESNTNTDTRGPVRQSVSVEGQWGTKITALLRDLLSLPTDHKVVIFSQWAQVLCIYIIYFVNMS